MLARFAFAVAVILFALPALAQTPPPQGTPTRIRGTVEKLDGQTLVVKSRDGQTLTVALAPNFTVSAVVKKSVADIKVGDFVGSASVRDKDGKLRAIEVSILPESVRGVVPESQFPWDLVPDSIMTNATLTGTATAPGGEILKVKYKDGEAEVLVPPGTPVVGFVPGDATLLKPGATIFISALKQPDGTLKSARVTAEKDGVKPPL